MSSIVVEQIDGSVAAFEAWRDGAPRLTAEQLAAAEPFIGERLDLTPEGPRYQAGWDTIEAAAVLLAALFPQAWIVTDPDIWQQIERPEGFV
jgi:hypothetical protein